MFRCPRCSFSSCFRPLVSSDQYPVFFTVPCVCLLSIPTFYHWTSDPMDTKRIISNMYRWRSLPRNEVWSAAGVFLRTSVLTGSKLRDGSQQVPYALWHQPLLLGADFNIQSCACQDESQRTARCKIRTYLCRDARRITRACWRRLSGLPSQVTQGHALCLHRNDLCPFEPTGCNCSGHVHVSP